MISGTGVELLSGLDSYTGNTTVNGGILEFASDTAFPTAAITVNSGGTVADGSAIDQTYLTHIAGGSTGTVALAANSNISLALTGLGVSLGSIGNYVYSGTTLTPNGTSYLLGGGGGLLTISSAV